LTAKGSKPTAKLAANLMGVGELRSEIDAERINQMNFQKYSPGFL
jgi:hypothetical protein